MSHRHLHLLIVDDYELFSRSIARTVRLEGYDNITVSKSVPQAIDLFLSNVSINVILSDIQIGGWGRDGPDLYASVAEELRRRRGIFIAMTGSSEECVREPLTKHGVPVLNKPFPIEDFLRFLSQH